MLLAAASRFRGGGFSTSLPRGADAAISNCAVFVQMPFSTLFKLLLKYLSLYLAKKGKGLRKKMMLRKSFFIFVFAPDHDSWKIIFREIVSRDKMCIYTDRPTPSILESAAVLNVE